MKQRMLDDDYYKFTMLQALLATAPETTSVHRFINRGEHLFNSAFYAAFQKELAAMAEIKATDDELQWLYNDPVMQPWFVDYIAKYQYDPNEVEHRLAPGGHLVIDIHGPTRKTMLWEVKLMRMISRLFFKHCDVDWSHDGQRQRIVDKASILDTTGCPYVDFGTRRRRDFESQNRVVETMKAVGENFVGTSNMHLARVHDVKCIGTTAHEWDQLMSILFGLRNAPKFAMEAWTKVYGGSLGIALSDTYGSKGFFRCFEARYAKLYDGVRHDSGNPYAFMGKTLGHYCDHGIDPKSKTIVFSDGLQVPLPGRTIDHNRNPVAIAAACEDHIKAAFGIGTDLTNDFTSKDGQRKSPALNMVIKLVQVNGRHVVKLSDDIGKAVGDPDAIRVANWIFNDTPLDVDSKGATNNGHNKGN